MCSNTNQTTTLRKCWVTLFLWITFLSFICGIIGYITHRVIQTAHEKNLNYNCGPAFPYKSLHSWDLDTDDPLLLGDRLTKQISKTENCQKREQNLIRKLKDWREKTGQATGADAEYELRILQDNIAQLNLAERNLSVQYSSFRNDIGTWTTWSQGFIDLPRNIFLASVGKYKIEKCWRSSALSCICETKNTTNKNDVLHFKFDLKNSFDGKLEQQLILHEYLSNDTASVKYRIIRNDNLELLWLTNKPHCILDGKIEKNTRTLYDYKNQAVVANIQNCVPVNDDTYYLCPNGNDSYLGLEYIYKNDAFKIIENLKTEDKLRLQYTYPTKNTGNWYGFMNLKNNVFTCAHGDYEISHCNSDSNICLLKKNGIDEDFFFEFDKNNETFQDYLYASIQLSTVDDQSSHENKHKDCETSKMENEAKIKELEKSITLLENEHKDCETSKSENKAKIEELEKLVTSFQSEIEKLKEDLNLVKAKKNNDEKKEEEEQNEALVCYKDGVMGLSGISRIFKHCETHIGNWNPDTCIEACKTNKEFEFVHAGIQGKAKKKECWCGLIDESLDKHGKALAGCCTGGLGGKWCMNVYSSRVIGEKNDDEKQEEEEEQNDADKMRKLETENKQLKDENANTADQMSKLETENTRLNEEHANAVDTMSKLETENIKLKDETAEYFDCEDDTGSNNKDKEHENKNKNLQSELDQLMLEKENLKTQLAQSNSENESANKKFEELKKRLEEEELKNKDLDTQIKTLNLY